MSTLRADGRPQLTPVGATVDAEGRVIVSTREPSMKTHNLRRDPRVSLCGLYDAFYGGFVQVEGTAEIVSQPEAIELLVDYYRRMAGEHDDWDDYRAAMVRGPSAVACAVVAVRRQSPRRMAMSRSSSM
jgi:PPOX class probable F420-dependent enzyme